MASTLLTPDQLGAKPVGISPEELGAKLVSPEELDATPISQAKPMGTFRSTLTQMESGDDYEAANPNSSARGRYQFVKATGDQLAAKVGVGGDWRIHPNDTEEQREYKKKAQDRMFDLWESETLEPGAASLSSIPASAKYTTPQLKALIHYLGLGGAKQYLRTGKDSAMKVKGNIPTAQYIERFRDAGGIGPEELGAVPVTEFSVADKITAGLQRQFAPFTLDKAEAEASYSLPAIGTNLAASIATYAGLPALGALAGPVGAAAGTVGAIGLGIYSALGEEYANAKVSDRKYDYKKAAINVLTEVNPVALLGKASKAGKAVSALSQAALQAEQARQYGAEGGGIALAAILGVPGGIGQAGAMRKIARRANGVELATAHKLANPTRRMTKEQAAAFLDDVSGASGNELRTGIKKRMNDVKEMHEASKAFIMSNKTSGSAFDELDNQKIAAQIEDDRAKFITWLNDLSGNPNKEDPTQGALDFLKHQGARADELFDTWREASIVNEEFVKRAKKKVTNLTGETKEAAGGVITKFDDLRNVAIKSDRTTGITKMEKLIDEVAAAHNKYSNDSATYVTQLDGLLKKTKKAGLSRKQFSKLMNKLDDVRLKHADSDAAVRDAAIKRTIPLKHEAIVNEWKEFSDDLFQYGVKSGMFDKAQYLEHYTPHIRVDQPTMISRLRREIARLETDSFDSGIKPGLLLKKEEYKGLKDIIGRTTDFGDDVNEADLLKFKEALSSPKFAAKASNVLDVSASHSREYKIPKFLLEDDVGRSFSRYIQNLSRAKHMSTPLTKLKNEVAIFDQLGMKKTADYWNKYIANMYGKKFAGQQQINDGIMRWKAFISKNADELQREMGAGEKIAYNAPEFMSWMMGSAYANLLGFSNVYAPIRNLGQPQLMTARELAVLANKAGRKAVTGTNSYVHSLATKAQLKATMGSKGALFGGVKKFKEQLIKEGRAPGDYIGEGMNVIENSLRNIPGIGKGVEAIDSLNQMGMKMYEASDIINRWTTRQMGKDLVKDAIKGKGVALQSISNIGGEYGALIREGLKNKNALQVEDAVIDYLLGKTQFHYGTHALSEFGRDYGKIVSMFTKWPASVGGEMLDMAAQKQFKALFSKYFSPIGGLFALQMGLDGVWEEEDPTRRAFLGKSLVDLSPMWAVSNIITIPPAISSLKDTVSLGQSALRGDITSEEVGRKAADITTKWLPVVGAIHTAKKRWSPVINDR